MSFWHRSMRQLSKPPREFANTVESPAESICDVTDREAVAALYDQAVSDHGGVDVSVQNAGIITIARVENLTEAEWDATMAVNTKERVSVLSGSDSTHEGDESGRGGSSTSPRVRRGTVSFTRLIMQHPNSAWWA